ncbi:hypothetical protein V8C34DRAFT_308708 [Trichoderma compactum]
MPVLVVGGGLAGLIVALQLARHDMNCMLVERNLDTTKCPKMDLTNCRSMELDRRIGISEGLREIGVPPQYSFDVLFSTGYSEGEEEIARWKLDSVDTWWQRIKSQNDGSLPGSLTSADYKIVDFSEEGKWAESFTKAAKRLRIPVKAVHLPQEKHVQKIWERTAVLVRPDDHVAWRLPLDEAAFDGNVDGILKIAVGQASYTEAGV